MPLPPSPMAICSVLDVQCDFCSRSALSGAWPRRFAHGTPGRTPRGPPSDGRCGGRGELAAGRGTLLAPGRSPWPLGRGRGLARALASACMHACMSQDDAVCTATRDVWPRWRTGVAPIVAARLRAGCSSAACRRGRTCTRPQAAARTANQGVGTAARQAPTAPSAPLQHRPALVIASRSARRCQHQHQPACPAMPFLCADGHTAALSPSPSPSPSPPSTLSHYCPRSRPSDRL